MTPRRLGRAGHGLRADCRGPGPKPGAALLWWAAVRLAGGRGTATRPGAARPGGGRALRHSRAAARGRQRRAPRLGRSGPGWVEPGVVDLLANPREATATRPLTEASIPLGIPEMA